MSSSSDWERGQSGGSAGCCKWLEEDWLARAREDASRQAAAAAAAGSREWRARTLPAHARAATWRLCRLMKAPGEGTPALAARLLESYLAGSARSTLTTLAMVADKSGKNLGQLCETAERRARARLPLTMASCVQIAGKMTGVNSSLSARRARLVLAALDQWSELEMRPREQSWALEDVIASEHAVLALLGYAVPLWTSLEAAELLAGRLGAWRQSHKAIKACVRLAELCRGAVEERVQWAGGLAARGRELLTDLLLAAGAVGAGVRLRGGDADRLAGQLAALVRAPEALLRCVVDVIVTLALE